MHIITYTISGTVREEAFASREEAMARHARLLPGVLAGITTGLRYLPPQGV